MSISTYPPGIAATDLTQVQAALARHPYTHYDLVKGVSPVAGKAEYTNPQTAIDAMADLVDPATGVFGAVILGPGEYAYDLDVKEGVHVFGSGPTTRILGSITADTDMVTLHGGASISGCVLLPTAANKASGIKLVSRDTAVLDLRWCRDVWVVSGIGFTIDEAVRNEAVKYGAGLSDYIQQLHFFHCILHGDVTGLNMVDTSTAAIFLYDCRVSPGHIGDGTGQVFFISSHQTGTAPIVNVDDTFIPIGSRFSDPTGDAVGPEMVLDQGPTFVTGVVIDEISLDTPSGTDGQLRYKAGVTTQPATVTGVVISGATGDTPTGGDGALRWTVVGTTLEWREPGAGTYGAPVDVSLGGPFTLNGFADGSIDVVVTAVNLPAGDEEDTDIGVYDTLEWQEPGAAAYGASENISVGGPAYALPGDVDGTITVTVTTGSLPADDAEDVDIAISIAQHSPYDFAYMAPAVQIIANLHSVPTDMQTVVDKLVNQQTLALPFFPGVATEGVFILGSDTPGDVGWDIGDAPYGFCYVNCAVVPAEDMVIKFILSVFSDDFDMQITIPAGTVSGKFQIVRYGTSIPDFVHDEFSVIWDSVDIAEVAKGIQLVLA